MKLGFVSLEIKIGTSNSLWCYFRTMHGSNSGDIRNYRFSIICTIVLCECRTFYSGLLALLLVSNVI